MAQQRIILAEDDKLLGDILAEKLEKGGYIVDRAGDGIEALEKIRATNPSLLVLDILMPQKSGLEVLEEMHEDSALKNIPVIIISNAGQLKEIDRVRKLGARDFIIKTVFDPNEVLGRINKILEHPEDRTTDWVVRSQNITASGSISSKSMETTPTPKEKQHILVVEDDKFLRELLVKKLGNDGFEVDSAVDGETAIQSLAKKTPHIILLDLILPKVDGFGVLEHARKDAKTKETPIVIFSNLGEKADIDKAMGLGATDYMVKANFTLDEITTKVHSILG